VSLVTQSSWWEAAVRGEARPIRADQVQPGYYATRAARGGALIPARIWQDGGRFFCSVAGEARDALQEWAFLAKRPISATTYALMLKNLKDTFASPKDARKAKLHDIPPRF
jgi:hypothetical protein